MARQSIKRWAVPLAGVLVLGISAATAQMSTSHEGTLQVDMRKLWEDHVS